MCAVRRVRAVVAYDGTDYSGFQRQANAPSVQEAIEDTLAQVTQQPVTIWMAGRTDAGTHAVGQVIAFDTAWGHAISELHRAMNAVLPDDIVVRDLEETDAGFHPRYDACSRRYQYVIYNASVPCPLTRRYSLHVNKPLDIAAMESASRSLIGEHDFATFGQPPQGNVTVRRVTKAAWREEPAGAGPFAGLKGEHDARWLFFDIEANAFLYRMVRSIVGTLLAVGRGWISEEAFSEAMAACDRGQAGTTAPAHGLCLMEVTY